MYEGRFSGILAQRYAEIRADKVDKILSSAGDALRQTMTVSYGLAHYTFLDAIDKFRTMSEYDKNREVCENVTKAFKKWEDGLSTSQGCRFFSVKDMLPETRAQYKEDLTDEEYFDMWVTIGAYAYDNYHPMLHALRYKYEKIYRNHSLPNPKEMSWAALSYMCAKISQQTYNTCIEQIYATHNTISRQTLKTIFERFSLDGILDAIEQSVVALFPNIQDMQITQEEMNDLDLGVTALYEKYSEQFLSQDNELRAIKESEELFRSKGTYKKRCIKASEINEKYKKNIKKLSKQNR